MLLSELKWHRYCGSGSGAWLQSYPIKGIYTYWDPSRDCYAIYDYREFRSPRVWPELDPLTAQAILFHLLNPEGNTP